MARRKGSGRGKSAVNLRRAPLENTRGSLKDELVSGSTRTKSQQKQQPNNDMEAATTTPTTTKHYNKTKFQNNQRRNNITTLTTTASTTKKQAINNNNNHNSNNNATNNLQTYRNANVVDAGGSNGKNSSNTMKSQKQTGKQGRAAKINAAIATAAAAVASATSATTGGKEAKEQKTATKTTATTFTANGEQNKADIVSHNNNKNNNNNTNTAITSTSNNKNSSNSSNLNSDNSNSLVVNKQQQQQEQQTQYEINKSKTQNINSSNIQLNESNNKMLPTIQQAANSTSLNSNDDSWSNSKYLHKKFKRLASTTEIDGNTGPATDESNIDAASKTRTTSLSSASSSVSSPPPSQQQQQLQQISTIHASTQNTLTNGYHQVEAKNAAAADGANAHMPPINVVNAIVYSNNNHKDFNTKYSFNSDSSNNSMVLATSTTTSNNNQQQQQHPERLEATTVLDIITDSPSHAMDKAQQQINAANSTTTTTTSGGRHVCPYCNLSCTKPSVLEKHIRAHTNERPFPCDICKIAFKTKSNYYKHCRSRSHTARSRGIEVPVDAEDGFSDQEGDPELSNSSSEVISRTDSPMDERSLTSPTMLPTQMQQHQGEFSHLQQPIALSHTHSPTPSPSTLSATKTTYLQQQQPHQLPLGSPAAGTLPPTANMATMPQQNSSIQNNKQQNLDFKPYKPKFHNAQLYATTKESNNANNASKQPIQTALNIKTCQNEQQQQQQVSTAAHLLALQQQQQQAHAAAVHPTQTPPNHASLSPSTHMKLNSHLNSQHQMQQQHVLGPPPPPQNAVGNSLAMSTPTPGVYYLGQPPNAAAIMHPGAAAAHLQQQFYDPVAAAVAHQQALAFHQFQMQQHHLQQQHQQQQQHLQLQYQQEQHRQTVPPSPVTTVIKPHATSLINSATPTSAQTRVHKSSASHTLSNSVPAQTVAGSSNNLATAGLMHGGVAAVASSGGGVHLNKEFLQEHISKLISQNEAIVENKELLLQKKYPKTLNRSRSFNNSNIGSTTSSSNSNNNNLVTTTTVNSESANAKLAQAIAQKKQLQMQHQQSIVQQQQHVQYQQQHHAAQHMEEPPLSQTQHYPINGLSKQAHSSTKQQLQNLSMQQQHYRQQPQSQPTQHMSQTLQLQAQHMVKEVLPMSLSSQPSCNNSPLNLSAKSSKAKETTPPVSSPALTISISTAATPKKRQSIEHQTSTSSETSTNSTSSVSSINTNNAASANKHPQNTSIIKNLLLNARGQAQPTGEGEHAVYVCPLCSIEFRTAEDLQTHTGSNCHRGINSAPITPVASPSHKYFRSVLNPLSLAKLAWSQLKTKPSNGVLNHLSASQASNNNVRATTTTTANSTSTAPTSASTLTLEKPLRLIDTPLPSPGPLLGKTPLVDSYNTNELQRNTESDVIITKMHDQFSTDHMPTSTKRARFEPNTNECFKLAPPPSGLLTTAHKKGNNLSGGDIQLITSSVGLGDNKKEERIKRFTSSGGSMIPISECSDLDKSPKLIRTPLLSGGSFQEVSPKKDKNEKVERLTIAAPNIGGLSNVLGLPNSSGPQHFQFPPINSITAFNPLTLPPLQTIPQTAEKPIPYVPGIPGPNTPHTPLLPPPPQNLQLPQPAPRNISPGRKSAPITLTQASGDVSLKDFKTLSPFGGVQNVPSEFSRVPPSPALRKVRNWPPNKTGSLDAPKKSFNFLRIADNLSPRKGNNYQQAKSSPPEQERRHFNFEAMAKEHELNIQTASVGRNNVITNTQLMPLHVDTSVTAASSATEPVSTTTATTATTPSDLEAKKSKFLRPTSLPLKPGTFTPKRHHGITPTANTLPLISPETPRPSKSCVQLYLNGHAYTYLGLKSSTKMFYCTVNCPQPSYVAGMHKLSMYSVWQTCAENNPHPMGLKPREVMSLYDSRQKDFNSTMAETTKMPYRLVTSQQTVMTPFGADGAGQYYHHQIKQIAIADSSNPEGTVQIKKEFNDLSVLKKDSTQTGGASNITPSSTSQLVGGYESHEDYTYIRGRGRGRYVCSECGIRCKKPSMLKKHIRTHTDVRPYTCKHCNFSFKTKGNLTKHMQSKTHYKKCIELGINPGPMPADGEFETEVDCDQQSTTSAGGRTSSIPDGESDSEDFSENESESSDTDESKSRLQEHEAARCLLSLSMTPPIAQSISPQLKTEGTSCYGNQSFTAEQQTAAIFTSASTPPTTHPSGIKRVVSFTQPKPPFDYQKQEQYYSNPEESKPKRSASAASTSFESTPIDLTKPRSNAPSPAVIGSKENSLKNTPPLSTSALDMISIPGPVQTKAQIRDVIFGKSSNESGFLRAVISVSDKVRSAAENAENAMNINENILLDDYRKEQALQYHKIKQSQMNRNSFPPLEENAALQQSQFATTPTASITTANLCAITSTTNSSILTVTSTVVVPSGTAPVLKEEPAGKTIDLKEQTQRFVPIIPEKQSSFNPEVPTTVRAKNDDIEGTLSASDSESSAATKPPKIKPASPSLEPYNANLPAAVHQPGTTDFSGVLLAQPRTVTVGENGFKKNTANEIQPAFPRSMPVTPEVGKPTCSVCGKSFQKQSQLTLHMNIHYIERKFKCEPCGVPFRTQGHLQKHERSEQHKSKVALNSTFGKPSTSNPRPFECTDCVIAFRIHGHLAKHLRSKGHVQKLECLLKLPIGTYAEIERAGINLGVIDTSDCENSLISLRKLADELMQKDPNKQSSYTLQSGDTNSNTGIGSQDSASEDDGFTAAASAAASAIASLENDSPNDTPRRRTNSTSEDDSIGFGGLNNLSSGLKRRLPNSLSQGEESDNPTTENLDKKRARKTEDMQTPTVAGGTGSVSIAPSTSNSAVN